MLKKITEADDSFYHVQSYLIGEIYCSSLAFT